VKILMLSHGYPPVISGVTLVVQKVAREMVRRGHEVTVVTASDRGPGYRDEDHGVQLIRVHSAPNPFWSEGRLPVLSYNELKGIVADVQPDIIHTHDGALLSMHLPHLEREKGRVPELLTCHYLPHFVTYYVHAGRVVEKAAEDIAWDVTMPMLNTLDHVVFPTRTQQQAFIEQGLTRPSTVISNGLDISRYNPNGPADKELEARYALPAGPRILFVGRLAKDKKLDVLIRAMPPIWSAHEAHLILVGRGDAHPQLTELAESLGMRDCVHFLGFVPEEDLPGLYRQCDIFAIASDVEVQSIPTLQAAATGLPIVAADAAALPELVEDDTNGFLVPPDNPSAMASAFHNILDGRELAARMGRASLHIGRRHAEQDTFDAYENLYRMYGQKAAA
jgi:1,2-diacylglycerol 3-alpha-glucosyltransferase